MGSSTSSIIKYYFKTCKILLKCCIFARINSYKMFNAREGGSLSKSKSTLQEYITFDLVDKTSLITNCHKSAWIQKKIKDLH